MPLSPHFTELKLKLRLVLRTYQRAFTIKISSIVRKINIYRYFMLDLYLAYPNALR